jgi:hypothetical protein
LARKDRVVDRVGVREVWLVAERLKPGGEGGLSAAVVRDVWR